MRPAAFVLLLATVGAGCGEAGSSATDAAADLTRIIPPAPGLRGGTAYEIFVRSFADSDGDGVGDLKGLTAHLDYLVDLGVEAVWLMPIFASPSTHGYDVTDYRAINPRYGTAADFDAFVAEAHRRGIKVVLDMVLNHSSSKHPWFVASQTGPASDKRSWYSWRAQDPHWSRPWDQANPWYLLGGSYYYGLFSSGMPDLNLANPAVESELLDVCKSWVARGVDGFRLDAARYFVESPDGQLADQPETHALLKRLHAALPSTTLVGEVWTAVERQASYWGNGDELQLTFSFDLAEAIKQSAQKGDITEVVNLLARSETAFKDRSFEAPFLSNHDQVRVMRALGFDAAAARVAAAVLFALPGTPFVYYGEELGMMGGGGGDDINKRTPMRWSAVEPGHGFTTGTPWYSTAEFAGVDVATQQADPRSLWNLYRQLIALRRSHTVLQSGSATRPKVSGAGPGVLGLLRTSDDERMLLLANFGASMVGPFTIDIAGTSPSVELAEGLAGTPGADATTIRIDGLAARGFAFIALH